MNKEDIKSFLIYLTVGAIIVLSINTYLLNERLIKMQVQLDEFYDILVDNQELIKTNKNIVGNLSEKVE